MVMSYVFDPDVFDRMSSEDLSADQSMVGPVEEALLGLPLAERTIVELVVFGGFTVPEAGRVAGVSRQWSYALWNRAKQKLRDAAVQLPAGVPVAS